MPPIESSSTDPGWPLSTSSEEEVTPEEGHLKAPSDSTSSDSNRDEATAFSDEAEYRDGTPTDSAHSSNDDLEGADDQAPEADEGKAPSADESRNEEQFRDAQVRVDQARAESQQIAGEMHFYYGDASSTTHRLTASDFELLSNESLEGICKVLMCDQDVVERLARRLRDQRVLCLVGAPDMGKGSMSYCVARELLGQERRLGGVARLGSVERTWKVTLPALVRDVKLQNKVLLVQNLFDFGNQDFLPFFSRSSMSEVRDIQRLLEEQGSFLLLTTDTARLPVAMDRLEPLGVLAEVPPPSLELLCQALRLRVESLRSRRRFPLELRERMETFVLEDLEPRVGELLGTIPLLFRFVDCHLIDVVEERLSLDEALRRMEATSAWLLEELLEEPEVWCFVVALTLGQVKADQRAVPALALYRLRDRLLELIDRLMRTDKKVRSLGELGVGEHFLQKARAEVLATRSSIPLARFIDGASAERLWATLLERGHGVLNLIQPELEKLASEEDFQLSRIAAQSLGRIGEVDPDRIIALPVSQGVKSANWRHHAALGQMLQGALTSGNRLYRSFCEERLLQAQADRVVALERASRRRELVRGQLLGLTVCWREVAEVDLQLAARGLRQLGEKGLSGQLEVLERYDLMRERVDVLAAVMRSSRKRNRGKAAGLDPMSREALDVYLAVLLKEPWGFEVVMALQFGVIGLCLAAGAVPALAEITGWLDRGEVSKVMGFVMLGPNGVADKLERLGLMLETEKESSVRVSRILASAYGDHAASSKIGEFLEKLHANVSIYPRELRQAMWSGWVDWLRGWITQAARVDELRPVVSEICGFLLASETKGVREDVFRLLKHDRELDDAGSSVQSFRRELLLRPPSRRRLGAPRASSA